jgi:hypothetical protein
VKACPSCSRLGMPAIHPGSQATARRCQLCGHVEELLANLTWTQRGVVASSVAYGLPPANAEGTAGSVGGPQ